MQSQPIQKQSLTASLINKVTNSAYKIDDYFTSRIELNSAHPYLYMLGKKYTYKNDKKLLQSVQLDQFNFEHDFNKIIWFSYRQKIEIENNTTISDAGWGCLIRVAQMLVAQTISKHLVFSEQNDLSTVAKTVISLFSDFEQDGLRAPYSIQQVIKRAKEEDYNIQIGQWYTGPKIMSIMEELHNKYCFARWSNFKIVNFFEQCIIEEEIEEAFKDKQNQPTGSVLTIIHLKLGMKEIPEKYVPQLQILLQMPWFVGSIAGRKTKAYFIVGFQDQNALYIDPHFIKDCLSSREEEMEKIDQFFAQCPKIIKISELSASIGLGYYFASLIEYYEFKKQIDTYFGNVLQIFNWKQTVDSPFSIYSQKQDMMKIYPNQNNHQSQFDGEFEII